MKKSLAELARELAEHRSDPPPRPGAPWKAIGLVVGGLTASGVGGTVSVWANPDVRERLELAKRNEDRIQALKEEIAALKRSLARLERMDARARAEDQ